MLNSAVFPGIQGGPLEHVIAAKAVAFGEALDPSYKEYQKQVRKNAQAMAEAFAARGYKIVTPAITTRGLKEDRMETIVSLIDRVLSDIDNETEIAAVRKEVNDLMANYPLFAW